MTMPNPMSPADLRHYLIFRALECRPRFWGDSSPKQYKAIAIYLDKPFAHSETQRRDRLDYLEYIFGRRFASTKGLSRSEASALLDHLTKSPPDVIATECQRCLVAYALERGQVRMEQL